MNRIKQTFVFDKIPQSDTQQLVTGVSTKQLDILSNFEKIVVQPSSTKPKKNENHNKFLVTMKSLFSSKLDLSNN